jgi:hypothetical protein
MNIATFIIQNLAQLAQSAWNRWEISGNQSAVKCALQCEAEMQAYLAKQSTIMWG